MDIEGTSGEVRDATSDWRLDEDWAPATGCHEPIPSGLADMDPGPMLAAFLASIDIRRISGHDRVTVLRAHRKMTSFFRSQTLDAMASVVEVYDSDVDGDRSHGFDPREGAAAEVRAALHLTRRAADAEVDLALALRHRLPAVADLLRRGAIDTARARILVDGTDHLPVGHARRICARILDMAPELTTGQLRARLRRLVLDDDPATAADRYRRRLDRRRLVAFQSPDGTIDLFGFDLPADRVAQAMDRIDALARSLRRTGEDRTMDQLRADVFLDLLSGDRHASATGGTIELRIDLDTLMGLADRSGELAGYGPLVADIARHVVADHVDGEWTYTVTHNGRAVATGTTRRRPTSAQRSHVRASLPTCVFPGCRMPASACDLDHRIPWAETRRTDRDDLAPGCRHDHVVKHRYGWTYTIDPDGTVCWRSPLGHPATSRPPP